MEDLSSYAQLPDELMEKVCANLDDPTLLTFIETYSRAYHVCKKVYDERKGKALVESEKRRILKQKQLEMEERRRQRLIQQEEQQRQRLSLSSGNYSNDTLRLICSSMGDNELRALAGNSQQVRTACANILAQRGINL